jgi:hypothetical protein
MGGGGYHQPPMGKAKKQLTNERRARRLGTGEGIARVERRRGVPAWAWLVGGAVILAAVIIAAAIVVRGGGSGSTASVVQSRLSHSKIDFVSQGTWSPNYQKLRGALRALGLQPSSGSAATNHYHVHLTLEIDGHSVPVPPDIGLDAATSTSSEIHTHDDTGVVHIESSVASFRGTLGQVFDVWGVAFDKDCIGGYCGGVKMWVNGTPSTQYGALVLKPHMAITLLVGTPPGNFKPDKSYAFPAGE